MHRAFLLGLGLGSLGVLHAQVDKLSVGLNTTYNTFMGFGLGATLEYQHQLCPHWVLVGQGGGLQFSEVAIVDRATDVNGFNKGWFGWAGLGLGYRAHADGHGFHCALLPGANWFPHEHWEDGTMFYSARPEFGFDLSIGHSIGRHMDLSLENWFYRDMTFETYGTHCWIPNFRLSWSLVGAR